MSKMPSNENKPTALSDFTKGCGPRRGSELAEAAGSESCCICRWTNTGLMNLGEFGKPRWVCHGCCKRILDAVEKIHAAAKRNGAVDWETIEHHLNSETKMHIGSPNSD